VESQFGSTYRNAVSFVIDPILIVILIVQVIAHPDFGLGILLNTGWMRYLGTISYSVYLYQQAVVRPVKSFGGSSLAISLPLTVLAVIVVASASYWIVERPFLNLKKRFEVGSRAVVSKTPLT
jgi:peptidoglycan/LPS O-acetylase OafA/YrhL